MRVQFLLRAPDRKSQRVLVRLASLGDQIVFNFGGKSEFTISQNMVRADVLILGEENFL